MIYSRDNTEHSLLMKTANRPEWGVIIRDFKVWGAQKIKLEWFVRQPDSGEKKPFQTIIYFSKCLPCSRGLFSKHLWWNKPSTGFDTAPLKISQLFEHVWAKITRKIFSSSLPTQAWSLIRKSAGIYNLESNLTSLIRYQKKKKWLHLTDTRPKWRENAPVFSISRRRQVNV